MPVPSLWPLQLVMPLIKVIKVLSTVRIKAMMLLSIKPIWILLVISSVYLVTLLASFLKVPKWVNYLVLVFERYHKELRVDGNCWMRPTQQLTIFINCDRLWRSYRLRQSLFFALLPPPGGRQPHYSLDVMGLTDTRLPSVAVYIQEFYVMSCYHPLKAFDISSVNGLTKNNKTNYKITSYDVNHIELINNKLIPFSDEFRSSKCDRYLSDFIEIPCGKCIGCRLDYSRDWANRMMLEASYHEHNYFITLTYDDLHVPKSYYACPETGEALPSLTLSKRDVQLFLKRLRKLTGQSFRYYLCGEYGSKTHRPHYHLIVFGLELDDLHYLRRTDSWNYYTSPTIERAWSIFDRKSDTSSPIGYSMVTSVCWETCAYVARYVTKKLNGSASEFYDTFNILPEFCLMSRRPGIARQYFEDNTSDILKYQKIILPSKDKPFKFRPPRYYDRLLDIDYPDEMAEIREIRKRTAENARKMKLKKTDLNYIELLAVEESNKLKKIKSLDRSEV